MKNNKLNYLLTLFIILVTVWILTSSSEVKVLPYLLQITNKIYIAGALLCMAVFWLLEGLIIKFIFDLSKTRRKFSSYLKIAMIGQYYNLITPFSSGGQPAQIYSMTNDYKIPLGLATSITINKFMVYHIIVTLFSLVMFVVKFSFINNLAVLSKTLIFLGLLVNTLGILVIFAMCYNSFVVEKIVSFFVYALRKLRLGKKIRQELIAEHLREYKSCLYTFLENKKVLLLVSVLTLLQVIIYFSVTYFVYLALGFSSATVLDILAIQSLLYMAVNFIPTPGNTGASEGGFYLLFGVIFPAPILLYAIILWRLIVYYFNLLATGSIVLADNLIKRYQTQHT